MSEAFNKYQLEELKQKLIEEYNQEGISKETAEKMAITEPRFILAQEIIDLVDNKAYILVAFQELGKRSSEIPKDNLPARSAVIGAIRRYKKLREKYGEIEELDKEVEAIGRSVKVSAEQFPYLSQIMNTLATKGLPDDVIKDIYIQKGEASAKSYYKINDICDRLDTETEIQGVVNDDTQDNSRQNFINRMRQAVTGKLLGRGKHQKPSKDSRDGRASREM